VFHEFLQADAQRIAGFVVRLKARYVKQSSLHLSGSKSASKLQDSQEISHFSSRYVDLRRLRRGDARRQPWINHVAPDCLAGQSPVSGGISPQLAPKPAVQPF
jgi:hypothetical protein